MADVFEVLRADHGDVRLLLAALESSPGHAAGASQQVLKARKLAAERLVIDSSRHEAAEQEYFWPAVRERLGDGSKLADEASAQEQEGLDALARLDQLEPDDDEFDELLAELIPAARRHIEFEETRVCRRCARRSARSRLASWATRSARRPSAPRPGRSPRPGPAEGAQDGGLGGRRRRQAEHRGHPAPGRELTTRIR